MKRADSLLRPFIADLGIEDGVRLDGIKRNWNTLFREPLSSHMSPVLFSRGELLITVDSPVWLQELNFYKEDIVNKLNSYGVGAIRFRLGRVSTNIKSEIRSRQPKVKRITDTEHAFIQDTVAKVPDEGLKETLKAAMAKSFTSRKMKIS